MNKENYINKRDLITIGIFFVLLTVARIVFEIIGGFAPIMYIFAPTFAAVLMAPIFMLYIAKVPRIGSVFVNSLITGIFYMLMGATWLGLVGFLIVGIIAELIRFIIGKGKKFISNLFAYAVYALGGVSAFLPFFLMRDRYYEFLTESAGLEIAYVEKVYSILTYNTLIAMSITTFIAAIIGGLIGHKMLEKHFVKAGVI